MPSVDTAVILCGGESRRAGFDKQLLPHQGTTLPKATARKPGTLFQEIIIVTRRPDIYADTSFMAVEDIVKGAGPLGGIFAALRHSTSEYSYVDAVATREGCDHIKPFNSFFSRRCAPSIEGSLVQGDRSVGSFLRKCDRARFVQEEDARLFSPDWSMFLNINTRADVARYLARYNDRRLETTCAMAASHRLMLL